MSTTTLVAIYGAGLSTCVAIFTVFNTIWARRIRLFVELQPFVIMNTGEHLRIGLAINVINIGAVATYVESVGIPIGPDRASHVGLHEYLSGERLPGKLQAGDHAMYYVDLTEARLLGLEPGTTTGFAQLSRGRRWSSKPLTVPPGGQPFEPPA